MFLNYFKQHAKLSKGAMETGDHSKNGASPKSHTSRENFKNVFFVNCLSAIIIFISFSANAQSSKLYGFTWDNNISAYGKKHPVVTYVTPYFPAWHSGLKKYDVILRINDVETSSIKTLPATIKTLEVRRIGQREPVNITMLPPVDYPENSLSEMELVTKLSISHFVVTDSRHVKDKYAKMNVYIDPEADLMDFCTFDFEYTNEENPALEKAIAGYVQEDLEIYGLKRDKENPDMLIFINFYTGTKENYVAPQTNITTRYRTEYNVWTKQRESRQYIESHNSGGYTVSKYLYVVQLSFLDAQAAQKQSKVAPVIWRGDYEKDFDTEQDNLKFADFACWELIDYAYPYKKSGRFYIGFHYIDNVRDPSDRLLISENSYFYTGLSYNSNDLRQITFVAEGSPADKAGIKAGDIVTKIDGTAVAKKLKKWHKLEVFRFISREDYIIYFSRVKKTMFFYLNYWSRPSQGAEHTVNFEIKRGNKKMKITVRQPESYRYQWQ
ncbi:MAG: PDZ domain-containing protein [Prevotellaceae bacterium]|jgi:hypothetical protein|nr:PDZ domain-containing protein [Prevotellaceae bacterium]